MLFFVCRGASTSSTNRHVLPIQAQVELCKSFLEDYTTVIFINVSLFYQ